jgi:hypothetical protein
VDIVFLRPTGNSVPSQSQDGGGNQIDVNLLPRLLNGQSPHDHFSVITHVELDLKALLTR